MNAGQNLVAAESNVPTASGMGENHSSNSQFVHGGGDGCPDRSLVECLDSSSENINVAWLLSSIGKKSF